MAEFRVEIRNAEPADSVGIARVQVETWRDAYVGLLPDGTLLDLDEMRAAIRWGRTIGALPGYERIAVAECDGRLVGFCHAGPVRQGVLQAGSIENGQISPEMLGEVYALYVEPDFQGMNLGRALLGDVTKHLTASGFRGLSAVTLVANTHARRFYEDLGGQAGDEMLTVLAGAPAEQVVYFWPEIADLEHAIEMVDG